MDIHVLLNGIMVKDNGLTSHGQSPLSVKKWSTLWTSQGCLWTLTMISIHGCFVKWHHGKIHGFRKHGLVHGLHKRSMDIYVLLNCTIVRNHGLTDHGLGHGV